MDDRVKIAGLGIVNAIREHHGLENITWDFPAFSSAHKNRALEQGAGALNELRTAGFGVIAPDWTPTAENVNALPNPLRLYIHELETVCDPAGDVRKLHLLKNENEMLRWECERLARGHEQ